MRKKPLTILCVIFLIYPGNVASLQAGEIVEEWAELLGQELWDLARNITNSEKIKETYISSNAQIEKIIPEKILSDIVDNVTKMLKGKMDAVRCILQAAESAAENYMYNKSDTVLEYYSSKYSIAENLEDGRNYTPKLPESVLPNAFMYLNMTLIPDTHFHNIEVDTDHSAVHVPTNVYDRSEAAQTAIEWSEDLDHIYKQNYNSDPALSWQYFCSLSGILRHFPAMHWDQEIDLFDCRTRSWFIEAATCSKDVVILLDNSGSMTGMNMHIARFTITKILKTLSNNDFINIFHYSDKVFPLEPCFNSTLVQATPENINILEENLPKLKTDGYANLGTAMIEAFKMLNESRESKDCGEDGTGCNQAIMVVTDGTPNNVTEIFEEYNWFSNGTNIPVRIFTYLIGREVSDIDKTTWMACLNRGYFVHVRSLDEAVEKVLKYIPVIARPLVLQAEEHPVSWTHAYITDNTFEDKTEGFEDYRLLTSVAVPAYDKQKNNNNDTVMAELLGVAGTDVPIDDIKKLTVPYKIGVNGYAFIVSNNGYLLMHPELRPVDNGRLNKNYNSMDLTEVEFIDDDYEPRRLNEKILELREAMINASEGSVLGLPMKHFYDEMRRVYKDNYDYYFAPLHGTPFTMAIALPQIQGNYWLKVGDEISKNQHLKIDIITDFFSGTNWKIHPEWVYCKYHYTEGHEFSTAEEELINFLRTITEDTDFTWPPNQYGEDVFSTEDVVDEEVECGRKTLDDDDYYCDEELMQRLVFDAKIMKEAFIPKNLNYKVLETYGATLKFMATMSGLTGWDYIYGEDENETVKDFGDVYNRAIDESWYKSAILQHYVDANSFVYSVPFPKDLNNKTRRITGSHAIFPREDDTEAPGCVVGFQFEHSLLNDKFKEIVQTNITDCEDCKAEWSVDMADSFVIDNNGYVVLSSRDDADIGMFFGEIEGTGNVMMAMLMNNTFDEVTVYDFQAVCVELVTESSSNILLTPFYLIGWALQWAFSKTMYLVLETSISQLLIDNNLIYAAPFDDYEETVTTERPVPKKLRKGQNQEEEDYFRMLREKPPRQWNVSYSCDKEASLFMLNQQKFIEREGYFGVEKYECSKPFFVRRIPHSNLLLVHVLSTTSSCDEKLYTSKREISYNNNTLACRKLELNELPRRKLSGCYNEHPLEHEIHQCGNSSQSKIKPGIYIINIIVLLSILKTYI